MRTVLPPAAMVETPIRRVLTTVAGRGKTPSAGFGIRRASPAPQRDWQRRTVGKTPCGSKLGSAATGAVATRGQDVGATAPAARGVTHAT